MPSILRAYSSEMPPICFVPDNAHYEGSSRMLFDEHNHPVSSKTVSREQRARCVWRRCYKFISLIHTNRSGDFFIYGAVKVVAGREHECPLLYRMVEQFCRVPR